ncbi:hypothetical protein H2198_000543 [Neophaeococcomyces mojaviensis]|uniref:Uncharacterized protein n=1 Tax=Neophaeococcomyces mojaviensis TaxID=3383035 RepID=A0ACC3AJY4_9EURO|nr:hypothetical protein H2198_000543 [Knufia sp. JES_112]
MHLRPVTQADLPAFGEVAARSMWNDELMAYTAPYRDQYPDSFIRYCTQRAILRYYRGEFLFLAVSDSSDSDWNGQEVVMGYASYSTTVKSVEKPCPRGWLGNAFERKALDIHGRYAKFFRLDWSNDAAAERHFRTTLDAPTFARYFEHLPQLHKQVKQDQHWELELLGVHPDFRRRGIGKMMLQWGFEKATRDGVPLILTATLAGEKLYLHCGFREVARVVLNLASTEDIEKEKPEELSVKLRKGEGFTWAAMVWEPPNFQTEKDTEGS